MRIVGIVLIVITVLAVVYAIVMLSKGKGSTDSKENGNGGRTVNGDSEINSTSRLVNYAGAWGSGCNVGGACKTPSGLAGTFQHSSIGGCRCQRLSTVIL